MTKSCQICGSTDVTPIYSYDHMPVFQNKVYGNEDEALAAPVGNILLTRCRRCSFIWNASFDGNTIDYDESYQNEQALSPSFQGHLEQVLKIVEKYASNGIKVVEIGCGKGYFLEILLGRNIDAVGFDPAYEGENPNVIKEYFSEGQQKIIADLIILRHTLEHIENPIKFLESVARANNNNGVIYIEVPDFSWIQKKNAFWDIFYEHCNYFSMGSMTSLFSCNIEKGSLFGGQYLYLISELSSIRIHSSDKADRSLPVQKSESLFAETIARYESFVKKHSPMLIWGAGAKGVTFSNMIDPERRYIAGIIDINPKKQNKHIAKTGHRIYSYEAAMKLDVKNILIMNENYFDEIKDVTKRKAINLFMLGNI